VPVRAVSKYLGPPCPLSCEGGLNAENEVDNSVGYDLR
jgi:hypothetical protein